jgi:hypothetical protein
LNQQTNKQARAPLIDSAIFLSGSDVVDCALIRDTHRNCTPARISANRLLLVDGGGGGDGVVVSSLQYVLCVGAVFTLENDECVDNDGRSSAAADDTRDDNCWRVSFRLGGRGGD